ncbi:MAG: HAD family phosphatase [Pseudomonadota bacterium]
MPSCAPPAFTAVLFGLSGCLVDFGARTLAVAVERSSARQSQQPLCESLRQDEALLQSAGEHAEAIPGALDHLASLQQQGVPCAWLSELPEAANSRLAQPLPRWLPAGQCRHARAWPAPDACWQALTGLGVNSLEGCVLVSGEPRLLQAGLHAGLWTIGLAVSGPLCGHAPGDWQALEARTRDHLRAQATLTLFRLGVHSVIDQLEDLTPGLAALGARRLAGEKA